MVKEISPSSENEMSLVASAKEGDERAFELLADAYKRTAIFHIKTLGAPDSMYDDLLQEGLIGLLKAVRSYDGKSSSFATFASLCIRNAIISGFRKYNRQTNMTVSLPDDETDTESSPSTEDVVIDSVRAGVLYEKVYSALSDYEKAVFDMYLFDMSYESIAFATGKSVKSTANAVYRIRTKLKAIVRNG